MHGMIQNGTWEKEGHLFLGEV